MQLKTKYWLIIIGVILSYAIISNIVYKNKIHKLSNDVNVYEVERDTLRVYKNKYNDLITEKQSFNITLSDLEKEKNKLSANNLDLLNTIKRINKEKNLLSSTTVHQSAVIDSLTNITPIRDTIKNTLEFKDDTEYLKYDLLIGIKTESLLIKHLEIPNKLNISHEFNNDKSKVFVKVVNSNDKYFKTNDINSYIIPIPKKKDNFKKQIKIFGIGVGIGAIGSYLLIK